MATSKQPRRRATPAELADRAEARARKLRADLEVKQIKAALAYYQGADRGRRNRDWQPKSASADNALINEAPTLVSRSRLAVANSWVGRAALRAYKRNVCGRGIEVVPTATDAKGADLADLNRAAGELWTGWASDRTAVDVETRRTWWQMQQSVVSEAFVTGNGMLVWSYKPHNRRVGLRLQLVEYEQLNTDRQSFDGRQVRNGVEIDDDGAPVAYHIRKRHPNDYLVSSTEDVRVEAGRVLHFFDAERAQQTIGEPMMAPVLQEIRDFSRYHQAHLWRAMMEACIGLIVKQNSTGVGAIKGLNTAPGVPTTTATGMPLTEMVPGMVARLLPGEEVETLSPTTPGNGFAPFSELSLRGIGAGTGLSFGALTRKNDANYSAARQDMLEDEREIGPIQDRLTDQIVMPVWELFYSFAVAEGRLPINADAFADSIDRYTAAEFIPPARPWIDPEKEANAYEKALKLRIMTRSEIVAQRGSRYANVVTSIAAERDVASAAGISLPEDVDALGLMAKADADSAKADVDRAAAEAQPDAKVVEAITEAGVSRGLAHQIVADDLKKKAAPNYRRTTLPQMACSTCSHAVGTHCKKFDFTFEPDAVCEAWAAQSISSETPGTGKLVPGPRLDGVPPFESTSARNP